MSNKPLSTFEREMLKPEFKEAFDKEYKEFLLSELIASMMEDDAKSVRKLAAEVDVSPTVIQRLRSGKQEDVKLSNFINIAHACGYTLSLQKGGQQVTL